MKCIPRYPILQRRETYSFKLKENHMFHKSKPLRLHMRTTKPQRGNLPQITDPGSSGDRKRIVRFLCHLELISTTSQSWVDILPSMHAFKKPWFLRICMYLKYIPRIMDYIITYQSILMRNWWQPYVFLLITRETTVIISYPMLPMDTKLYRQSDSFWY